jgi:ProP effector
MRMRRILLERFPACFKPFLEVKAPLKIGIRQDLVAAAPDLDPYAIRLAVRDYCYGRTYHQAAMVAGAQRIGVHGEPAGEVKPEHAANHAFHFQRISANKAREAAKHAAKKAAKHAQHAKRLAAGEGAIAT